VLRCRRCHGSGPTGRTRTACRPTSVPGCPGVAPTASRPEIAAQEVPRRCGDSGRLRRRVLCARGRGSRAAARRRRPAAPHTSSRRRPPRSRFGSAPSGTDLEARPDQTPEDAVSTRPGSGVPRSSARASALAGPAARAPRRVDLPEADAADRSRRRLERRLYLRRRRERGSSAHEADDAGDERRGARRPQPAPNPPPSCVVACAGRRQLHPVAAAQIHGEAAALLRRRDAEARPGMPPGTRACRSSFPRGGDATTPAARALRATPRARRSGSRRRG
jgi:hypothetical protein